MYTLIRYAGLRNGMLAEAPALLVSLVVAEMFYKFHSFTLECGCFLVTWLAISSILSLATKWLLPARKAAS